MTRNEARTETSRQLSNARETLKLAKNQGAKTRAQNKIDYLVAVQKALCEPIRETVERMRGEWINAYPGTSSCKCTKCGAVQEYENTFCCHCGAPMTDEAVEILVKRMEEMRND